MHRAPRHAVKVFALLLLSLPVWLAAADDGKEPKEKPVALLPGLGKHHHPITTSSPEAQKFFDQGMVLLFGFNHAEAARSFRRAAGLDPKAVMPQWGLALALGPNYNRDVDPVSPDRNKQAHEAAQKALALSAKAPAREQAYAKAIVQRYSPDPKADGKKLETAYKDAMADLSRRFPDDQDAATLYAEALMNLRPWQLWSADGKPAEGTEEIVRVLEGVIKRYPDHPGANHYYIHTMEASPYPERALTSAHRLMTLVPGVGHLVHMPGHIFMHTGDYELAAVTNERAVKADEDFFRQSGTAGVYRMMYYPHHAHFIAVARLAQGRYKEAKQAADKLAALVAPAAKHEPGAESFLAVPLQVDLRFGRSDDVLASRRPDTKMAVARSFWHYARAQAFVAKGQAKEAAAERGKFDDFVKRVPAEAPWGFNPAPKVLAVAAAVLDARLASDKGASVAAWEKAVGLQDALNYAEPPDWYYPVRESLGAALLTAGRPADAEKVFRADLTRNRRNGRSLFGLMESLKAQKKTAEAALVRLEYERAWGGEPLRMTDLE